MWIIYKKTVLIYNIIILMLDLQFCILKRYYFQFLHCMLLKIVFFCTIILHNTFCCNVGSRWQCIATSYNFWRGSVCWYNNGIIQCCQILGPYKPFSRTYSSGITWQFICSHDIPMSAYKMLVYRFCVY